MATQFIRAAWQPMRTHRRVMRTGDKPLECQQPAKAGQQLAQGLKKRGSGSLWLVLHALLHFIGDQPLMAPACELAEDREDDDDEEKHNKLRADCQLHACTRAG